MELHIIWNILKRRRVLGLLIFLAFFFFVILFTLIAPKSYEATTKVTVEKSDKLSAVMTGIGISGTVLGGRVYDDDYSFDTDIELAMIRPLIVGLIEKLDIKDDNGRMLKSEKFLKSGLGSKIKRRPAMAIDQYNDSGIISFTATSPSPEQAAKISNELAEMYIQSLITRMRADFAEVRHYIQATTEKTRERYYQGLISSAEFKKKNKTVNIDTDVENIVTRITEIKQDIDTFDQGIFAAQKSIKTIKEHLNSTEKLWESSENLQASSQVKTLRTKLSDLVVELSRLDITLTNNNPQYAGVVAQIDKINGLIEAEPDTEFMSRTRSVNPIYQDLVSSLSKTMILLDESFARREALKKQLVGYQEKMMTYPDIQIEDAKLKAELNVSSGLHQSMLKYLMQLELAEKLAVSKIRIVEPADVPEKEAYTFPNTTINIILAIIFGMFFAFVAVFIREYTDETLKTEDDLSDIEGLRLLGSLSFDRSVLAPESRFIEQVKAIRDSLRFSKIDNKAVIVVSSTSGGGGATTVASSLAKVHAEKYGSTVLVDLDLRKSGLTEHYALKGELGVTDIVFGNADLVSCIKQTSIDGLSILPSGTKMPEPGKIVDSPEIKLLLNDLRNKYSTVFVDTPSIDKYNDSISISEGVDIMLIIACASGTTKSAVKSASHRAKGVGCKIVATVLNAKGYARQFRDILNFYKRSPAGG